MIRDKELSFVETKKNQSLSMEADEIKQKRWIEGWMAATLFPFCIWLLGIWYFGSAGGYEWTPQVKVLVLALQVGFITMYFLHHRLYQAVISLWVTLAVLLALSFIVPYLAGEAHVVLDMEDVSGEVSTPIYLFITCLTAAWLLPGKFRILARGICAFFLVLYALVQFTYIGYFTVTKALVSVNMMLAMAQTNLSEAISYMDVNLPAGYLLGGVVGLLMLGGFLFWLSRHSFKPLPTETKVGWLFVAILFFINCGLTALSLGDTRIARVSYESYETLKSFGTYQSILEERRKLQVADPLLLERLRSVPDGIYVLVIGESLTRDHMGVYGYERNTTPFQALFYQDPHYVFFNHAYSCYTQTVQVLTCALTEKNQYNGMNLSKAYSIIDLARDAGFETTWISNQSRFGIWDTPIGAIGSACDNQYWINQYVGTDVVTKDYDSALVSYLRKINPQHRRQLIVIHLMGSHISYWDRYPTEFYKWPTHPDKERSTEEVMVDEYDNSVLFNDYVIASIMNEAVHYLHADGVVYFSDHGEEVTATPGHNADQFNFMMVRIPFWVYTSEAYDRAHGVTREMMERQRNTPFSNDMIYDTLMGLMGITVTHYDETCDLFSSRFNKHTQSLMTMYGNVMIADDKEELGKDKSDLDEKWNQKRGDGGRTVFDWSLYRPINLTESQHKEVNNDGPGWTGE